MYCAWRIPAHLRCTQCSILLHLMDICFLTCICLLQISQIQTFLFRVVGPGLVSTSPAFVSNSASNPAGPHGRHAQKNGKSGPHCWGRGGSTQFAQQLEFAVTAPTLVGCVVWSPQHNIISSTGSSSLPHLTRRTLAQPRSNKSYFLKSYLHKVDAKSHQSPLCTLSLQLHPHAHHIVTPGFVNRPRRGDCSAGQMDGEAGPQAGRSTPPPHYQGLWEWVDNNTLSHVSLYATCHISSLLFPCLQSTL